MQTADNVKLAIFLPEFDGPFDLLLSLIRRNEYPMDSLPVVTITGEFLAYVREAESIDMDLGGEFMETASWLVLLKSKSLLPREAGFEAQQELRNAVQQYELDRNELDNTKKLLVSLRSKKPRVAAAGAAPSRRIEEVDEKPEPTASDVVRRVRSAIASVRAAASFNVEDTHIATVEEQKTWVLDQTKQFPFGTPLTTEQWFTTQTNNAARASLLLALLELGRTGDLLIYQHRPCGAILVKRIHSEVCVSVYSDTSSL